MLHNATLELPLIDAVIINVQSSVKQQPKKRRKSSTKIHEWSPYAASQWLADLKRFLETAPWHWGWPWQISQVFRYPQPELDAIRHLQRLHLRVFNHSSYFLEIDQATNRPILSGNDVHEMLQRQKEPYAVSFINPQLQALQQILSITHARIIKFKISTEPINGCAGLLFALLCRWAKKNIIKDYDAQFLKEVNDTQNFIQELLNHAALFQGRSKVVCEIRTNLRKLENPLTVVAHKIKVSREKSTHMLLNQMRNNLQNYLCEITNAIILLIAHPKLVKKGFHIAAYDETDRLFQSDLGKKLNDFLELVQQCIQEEKDRTVDLATVKQNKGNLCATYKPKNFHPVFSNQNEDILENTEYLLNSINTQIDYLLEKFFNLYDFLSELHNTSKTLGELTFANTKIKKAFKLFESISEFGIQLGRDIQEQCQGLSKLSDRFTNHESIQHWRTHHLSPSNEKLERAQNYLETFISQARQLKQEYTESQQPNLEKLANIMHDFHRDLEVFTTHTPVCIESSPLRAQTPDSEQNTTHLTPLLFCQEPKHLADQGPDLPEIVAAKDPPNLLQQNQGLPQTTSNQVGLFKMPPEAPSKKTTPLLLRLARRLSKGKNSLSFC